MVIKFPTRRERLRTWSIYKGLHRTDYLDNLKNDSLKYFSYTPSIYPSIHLDTAIEQWIRLFSSRRTSFLFPQAVLLFSASCGGLHTRSRIAKNGTMIVAMAVLAAVSVPSGWGTYTMPFANKRAAW